MDHAIIRVLSDLPNEINPEPEIEVMLGYVDTKTRPGSAVIWQVPNPGVCDEGLQIHLRYILDITPDPYPPLTLG